MVLTPPPAIGAGNTTLTWNSSTSSNVMGYFIYYGGASGTYTHRLSVGKTNSVTITNLTTGRTYYFAATGYDAAGNESAFSNQAMYMVPRNTPGQPLVLGRPSSSGGRLSFAVPGVAGSRYAVEASGNLANWVRVVTNTAPFTFVETNAGKFGQRFFRAVRLP